MRHEGSKKVTEYYQARYTRLRKACLLAVILSLVAFAYINRQELGQELQKLSKSSIAELTTAASGR